jgi:hypothetical protein
MVTDEGDYSRKRDSCQVTVRLFDGLLRSGKIVKSDPIAVRGGQ